MSSELLAYGEMLLRSFPEGGAGALPHRIVVKPLRSALYVPANRREWLQKCAKFGSDAIVVDLEDAVLAEDRGSARQIVSDELSSLGKQVRSVWVRVNSDKEEMMADLEAAVQPGLAVIQLSKVSNPEAVLELDRALSYLEGKRGLPHGSVAINPILETANGIHKAFEIACCSRRVEYLGGMISPAGDTARALRINAISDPIGSESLYLRSKIVLEARAAGILHPLGGVVTDLAPDFAVFKSFATANRNMGYSGMFVIHPSHVAVANAIFAPSDTEIQHALQTLAAFRASVGRGAIRGPRGEMIDMAHVRTAAIVLHDAKEFGMHIGSETD